MRGCAGVQVCVGVYVYVYVCVQHSRLYTSLEVSGISDTAINIICTTFYFISNAPICISAQTGMVYMFTDSCCSSGWKGYHN